MSLTESIVEDAALEWFHLRQGYSGQVGELGYSCLGAEALTPTLSRGERESYGEVVLVGRLRAALRQINPTIPEEALRKVLRLEKTRLAPLPENAKGFREIPEAQRRPEISSPT